MECTRLPIHTLLCKFADCVSGCRARQCHLMLAGGLRLCPATLQIQDTVVCNHARGDLTANARANCATIYPLQRAGLGEHISADYRLLLDVPAPANRRGEHIRLKGMNLPKSTHRAGRNACPIHSRSHHSWSGEDNPAWPD